MSHTFNEPLELEAVRLWLVTAPADEPLQELALAVDLTVAHRDPELGLLLDSRTYLFNDELIERLNHDLGPFSPAALRKVQAALLAGRADEPYRDLFQDGLLSVERHLHYRVMPAAQLPLDVEHHLSALAETFYRDTRQRLVITSGTRTPETQAAAMLGILRHGASFQRLYRKRAAAMEIKRAYLRAQAQRLDTRQIIHEMAEVIRQQVARGVYISPHLRAGAIDIRSRDMTRALKTRLRQAVATFPNMRLNREELRPPHFHMEVYTKRWPGPSVSRAVKRGKRSPRRQAARLRTPRSAPR